MSDAAAVSPETADKGNVYKRTGEHCQQYRFRKGALHTPHMGQRPCQFASIESWSQCEHERTGLATRWTYKAMVGYLQEHGWE